jgi:hypothetical protein
MNVSWKWVATTWTVLSKTCVPKHLHRLILISAIPAITTVLLSACLSNLVTTSEPFSEADLVGTWRAVYDTTSPYITIVSTETLTLRADGTYTQVFARGTAGMVDEVDGKRWFLDEAKIIHLAGGMWPQLGPERSRMFAQGLIGGVYSIRNKELPLNVGEAYLLVSSIGNGRLEMSHLPTGDPDNRYVVWFERIDNSSR